MISNEQIECFATDGVVLLKDALSAAWIERALELWTWSVRNPGPLASTLLPDSDRAFQDLCNPAAPEQYADFVRDSPLADYAAALWETSAVWYMYEQVFHKPGAHIGRTPWHQDTSYLAVNGEQLIAFWISFEGIAAPNALEFVRGSHRGPLYNTSRFDPDDPTLPIVGVETMQNLPDIERNREAFDIVSFATQPGDVLAFHLSTLHGGGGTDSGTPARRTLTLRFFGPDAVSEPRGYPAGPYFEGIRFPEAGRQMCEADNGEYFRKVR